MRKDVLLLPVLVLGVVISGCSGSLSDASAYGEEIFKCDPDNIMGFEGAFIEGERVTLVFDEEYASDGEYPVRTRYYFREEQIPSRDRLTVYTEGNNPVVLDSNEIEVDADAMTISFEVSLPKGDENKAEILAYLKRYRKAGSDHSGYYIVKNDNPNPSNKEIIEGLVF